MFHMFEESKIHTPTKKEKRNEKVKQPWFQQFEPTTIKEYQGRTRAFAKNSLAWAKGGDWKKQPLLLFGGTGHGKTLWARLLAKKQGWNVHIDTLSDLSVAKAQLIYDMLRRARESPTPLLWVVKELPVLNSQIHIIATVATTRGRGKARKTVFKPTKMPFWKWFKDHIVKNPLTPTIIISEHKKQNKVKDIVRSCKTTEVTPLKEVDAKKYLTALVKKAGHKPLKEAIERMVGRFKGDLRASINNLEFMYLCPPTTEKALKRAIKQSGRYNATLFNASGTVRLFTDPKQPFKSKMKMLETSFESLFYSMEQGWPYCFKGPGTLKHCSRASEHPTSHPCLACTNCKRIINNDNRKEYLKHVHTTEDVSEMAVLMSDIDLMCYESIDGQSFKEPMLALFPTQRALKSIPWFAHKGKKEPMLTLEQRISKSLL
jgi:hypothetical protein